MHDSGYGGLERPTGGQAREEDTQMYSIAIQTQYMYCTFEMLRMLFGKKTHKCPVSPYTNVAHPIGRPGARIDEPTVYVLYI